MEVLALLFVWPFLILTLGLVFISLNLVSVPFFWVIAAFFLLILFSLRDKVALTDTRPKTDLEQLETARRVIIVFSLASLLPIFTRYFIAAWRDELPGIILAMAVGFAALLWGMFAKNNRVLTYGNVIGGIITLIYTYFRIWELGELARVIAAAFGLAVAVAISIIKLKERLK